MDFSKPDSPQWPWVLQVRDSVRAKGWAYRAAKGPSWDHISFQGPKKNVEHFLYKPVAMCIPHLQLPGYIPACPRPTCNTQLVSETLEFIDHPRVVFGMGTLIILDGVQYRCKCGKTFRPWDKESLKKDESGMMRTFFRFHFTRSSVVTRELYQHIVASTTTPTTHVVDKLKEMAHGIYCETICEYLHSELAGQTSPSSQTTIQQHFSQQSTRMEMAEDSTGRSLRKRMRDANLKERNLKLKKTSASSRASNPIDLKSILMKKKGKDKVESLQKLGEGKLKRLIEAGFSTAREFQASVTAEDEKYENLVAILMGRQKHKRALKVTLIEGWSKAVADEFAHNATELRFADTEYEKAREAAAEATKAYNDYKGEKGIVGMTNLGDGRERLPDHAQAEPCEPREFPLTTEAYGLRTIQRSLVDKIQKDNFVARKPVMVAEMSRIDATVLRMDANYKIPSKIYVVKENRERFKPWKSMTVVRNEYNETIWWGMLAMDESYQELGRHLEKLKKERIDRLHRSIQVIYVDKCCELRATLQRIFGEEVPIKLDVFHWIKRWDDILANPSGKEARIFKILLSRAVMVIPDEEYSSKAAELREKLKKPPTVKQILSKCATVIPEPRILKQRVDALLKLKMFEESQKMVPFVDVHDTNGEDSGDRGQQPEEPPDLLFKVGTSRKLQGFIAKQMRHITENCLSDPPGVTLHFGEYCARGSSSCELLFSQLDTAFRYFKSIGLVRAEMILWNLLSTWNRKARVSRRGETDYGVRNTETMLLANSLCVKANYKPVFHVSASEENHNEVLGFDLGNYFLQRSLSEDNDQDDLINEAEQRNEDSDDGGDLVQDRDAQRALQDLDRVLTRDIRQPLTSMQRFVQATNYSPFVPLSDDKGCPIASEERTLFDSLIAQGGYRLEARTWSRHGFGTFALAWSRVASERYDKWRSGENITMIRHKSANQLKMWYKKLLEQRRNASLENTATTTEVQQFRQTLRETRRDLAPIARAAGTVQQVTLEAGGSVPLGNPLTLNSDIATAGIQVNTDEPAAPFHVPILQHSELQERRAAIRKLPPGVNHRTICIKCGQHKREHPKNGFGRKSCPFAHCGRCGVSFELHHPLPNPKEPTTGFYCRSTPEDYPRNDRTRIRLSIQAYETWVNHNKNSG